MTVTNRLCRINQDERFLSYSEAQKTDTMKKKITIKGTVYKKKKTVSFKANFIDTIEIQSYKSYNYEDIPLPTLRIQKKEKIYCKCYIV